MSPFLWLFVCFLILIKLCLDSPLNKNASYINHSENKDANTTITVTHTKHKLDKKLDSPPYCPVWKTSVLKDTYVSWDSNKLEKKISSESELNTKHLDDTFISNINCTNNKVYDATVDDLVINYNEQCSIESEKKNASVDFVVGSVNSLEQVSIGSSESRDSALVLNMEDLDAIVQEQERSMYLIII